MAKRKKIRAIMISTTGKTQREIVEAAVRALRQAGMLKETARSRKIK